SGPPARHRARLGPPARPCRARLRAPPSRSSPEARAGARWAYAAGGLGALRVRRPVWESRLADQAALPVELVEQQRPESDELVARGAIENREDRLTIVRREGDELLTVGDGVEEHARRAIEPGAREHRREVERSLAGDTDAGQDRHRRIVRIP